MSNFNEGTSLVGPYAYGGPLIKGRLKQKEQDFIVIEELGYDLTGEGEHVFCYVQKTSVNTEYVANCLALFANVNRKLVNYAGLKDKQAQTEQWFSIHLPGKVTPDFTSLSHPNFSVIKQKRHLKKLQRGALKGNHFTIRLRNISGNLDLLDEKIQLLSGGFPNYFGEQRFGHNGQNLTKAKGLFFDKVKVKNKQLKGLLYSATRSWLFNLQLAHRVKNNTWNRLFQGDLVNLSGGNSVFVCDDLTNDMIERSDSNELAPAGILWGKCDNLKFQSCHDGVRTDLASHQEWLEALESNSLLMMTRPFACFPQNLTYTLDKEDIVLSFFLRKGSYATVLIRELLFLGEG